MNGPPFEDHPVYGKVLRIEFETCTWRRVEVSPECPDVQNAWSCNKQWDDKMIMKMSKE